MIEKLFSVAVNFPKTESFHVVKLRSELSLCCRGHYPHKHKYKQQVLFKTDEKKHLKGLNWEN